MLYQDVINDFISMSQSIFMSNLTGIYLHGSMAMNCFNPEKSDIDIIIVIKNDLSDEQKKAFMNQVVKLNERAPIKGFEISVVKEKYCKSFVYPTPFELHFSPMHLSWFINNPDDYVSNMNGKDKDLAAHFTIINKYGIVLFGEKINDVFGIVSKDYFVDSIYNDIEYAIENIESDPVYFTLNLCRVLAALKNDLYLSKQLGGEWALNHLPSRYHSLIGKALDCYKTKQIIHIDLKLSKQFASEMLSIIKGEIESGSIFNHL